MLFLLDQKRVSSDSNTQNPRGMAINPIVQDWRFVLGRCRRARDFKASPCLAIEWVAILCWFEFDTMVSS